MAEEEDFIKQLEDFAKGKNEDPPQYVITKTNNNCYNCKVTYSNFSVTTLDETEKLAKEMSAKSMLAFLTCPENLKPYCIDNNIVQYSNSKKDLKSESFFNGLEIASNNDSKHESIRNEISHESDSSIENNTVIRPQASSLPESFNVNSLNGRDKTDSKPVSKLCKPDNPIGFLQEYAVKNHIATPIYNEVRNTSNSDFNVLCTFNNLKATGCGVNKKLAKRIAAEQMIQQLNLPSTVSIENDLSNLSLSEKSFQSWINTLHEYIVKINYPIPKYETVSRSGVSEKPPFEVKCIVGEFIETAIGNTKKEAKHDVSAKMYNLIKQTYEKKLSNETE